MFVCLECGNVFEEPQHWKETHGLDYGSYESFSGCPDCAGAYVEAYYCDCCGEVINTSTYVEIEGDKYCANCFTVKNLEDI